MVSCLSPLGENAIRATIALSLQRDFSKSAINLSSETMRNAECQLPLGCSQTQVFASFIWTGVLRAIPMLCDAFILCIS
jgi:hypothetical protein